MTGRLALGVAAALLAHANEAELRRAFVGKQVIVRVDMPGTHHGVDLNLDRDDPMDWKQYSQRLKNFGVSIPKGRSSTVTSLIVKKDLIELQLDGGGFGTFGDDTSTSVSTYVPKSSYESRLERDISRETDAGRKRRLQSDLDRERNRRRREEARLRAQAETANAIKRQEVMEKRLRGGSRFNLRRVAGTAGVLPNQMMDWLREYVDFGGPAVARPVAPSANSRAILRRGMSIDEVRNKLGDGKLLSESVGAEGVLTQQWEFVTAEQKFVVTAVEGLMVKYAMTAR
ncbi:MAG: hypothetical protein HYX27_18135 [Acidobacteria bacterium]|nr:hypothetical protein [Acidobacteriota bacterium]